MQYSIEFMKKIILPVAILAILSSSCQKEQISAVSGSIPDYMDGLLVSDGELSTKCSGGSGEMLMSDMPYVTQNGDTLYISAFLSDMDEVEPAETKGAPINQSLLNSGYKSYDSLWVRAYAPGSNTPYVSSGGGKSETMDNALVVNKDSKWHFAKKYYWPGEDDLYFISIAPYFAYDKLTWSQSWDSTNKKFSFKFQSIENTPVGKENAEEQVDLLVGCKKQNKLSFDSKVKIEYKHVCVGVRFEMGDIFGKIKYVQLKNFFKNCNVVVDESGFSTSTYSSDLYNFTQTYNFSTEGHTAGDDFDDTANHDKTFMIVPQKVVGRTGYADGELIVQMDNTLHPEELSFKDMGIAKLNDWSSYSGKIITFRITSTKANNVSVTVTDEVVGLTKKNIVVKNDGKSDIMIRVKPVGNWLNSDGEIIASWEENEEYGTFSSKNNYPGVLNNVNWKKGSDGFYYYRKYLKTGKTVSENLFDSYTIFAKPVDATGTWAQGGTKMQITTMELVLLVQAIIAEEDLSSFKAAWGTEMVSWIGVPVSDE